MPEISHTNQFVASNVLEDYFSIMFCDSIIQAVQLVSDHVSIRVCSIDQIMALVKGVFHIDQALQLVGC